MNDVLKKTVAVLFGGRSSEHSVSLVSAASVIENIPREKYDVILLGITRAGQWFLFDGDVSLLPNDKWCSGGYTVPAVISPDTEDHGILVFGDTVQKIRVDVVFPVLHGKNGEDGTVQGLLELSGIPYVGCNTVASAACMDKAVTNSLADAAGIRQAKWLSFSKAEYIGDPIGCIGRMEQKLEYPVFVKPACAGSSVGITKAHGRDELQAAFETALREDGKVVVEENIDGFEVECAVLGNEEILTGVVGQIVPCNAFYDYEAKYTNPASELHIPALISAEKQEAVRAQAVRAYRALGCEGMARVDFFVGREDGTVFFNEINTIPGFTSISMYPKLFEAAGLAYADLTDRLITLAIERNGESENT